MNAIDDIVKPKQSLFFELSSVMRNILMDLDIVGRKVNELEMRFNPKSFSPKRSSS